MVPDTTPEIGYVAAGSATGAGVATLGGVLVIDGAGALVVALVTDIATLFAVLVTDVVDVTLVDVLATGVAGAALTAGEATTFVPVVSQAVNEMLVSKTSDVNKNVDWSIELPCGS